MLETPDERPSDEQVARLNSVFAKKPKSTGAPEPESLPEGIEPSSAVQRILGTCWQGAHGEQKADGDGYYKVDGPVTDEMVQQHLKGERAYTVFISEPKAEFSRILVLDFDNKAKYDVVLTEADLDAKTAEVVAALRERTGTAPLVCVSTSGSGRHLWTFFEDEQPSDGLHRLASDILHECGLTEGKGSGIGEGQAEIFVNPAHGVALPQFAGNPLCDTRDLTKRVDEVATIGWSQVQVDRPRQRMAVRRARAAPVFRQTDVADALEHLDADEYDDWVRILLALKQSFGEDGWQMAVDWSSKSAKFDEPALRKKWASLKPNGDLTAGSIIFEAMQHGWVPKNMLTDLGNVNRLVQRHGENLLYVRRIKIWLHWDGARWVENDNLNIQQAAKDTVQSILQEAMSIEDVNERQRTMQWAIRSQSAARIEALIKLASNDKRLSVFPEDLDRDPYLLGVKNGVVDLRNGQLVPPERDMLITKQANAAFRPGADCPRWLAFQNDVTLDDDEMIAFKQRMMGYILTGDTSEQCMFIEHGVGNNGKSVENDVLVALLGDYARTVPAETFLVRRGHDNIPNDLAGLHGARLAMCGEPEDNRSLKEGLVKSATGGDRISARFLRKEWFDFYPQFKLVMVTNHKPRIRGDDTGIWRRIRLIGYQYTVPKAKRDKHLAGKLKEERDGILQWLLEGCKRWQEVGLDEPEQVQEATREYRNEEDMVRQWVIEECRRCDDGAETTVRRLYASYVPWMEAEGAKHWTMTKNKFSRRLVDLGFKKVTNREGYPAFVGIRIKVADTPSAIEIEEEYRHQRQSSDTDDPTF